ncbi:MAG: SDR family oxidoreductase [Gammaproteobacteria bacterium]|jgi:NAD(P)-dependent dehydrogenase (short-subunit alcohol dehydrogenase family)
MPNVLITGANRGIGLELARQYREAGWRVFATCRHPAEAADLQALANGDTVSLHRLDVTSVDDIYDIAWEMRDTPIDVLLNNAGVYLEWNYLGPELGAIRYDDWMRTIEVNTFGAVRLTEKLFPNVKQSERRLVATITSHMGSIADIDSPGSYYYRSSKAALNAAMQGLAEALKSHGVGVLLLHPGGVKTRMGPADGISAGESVQGMRRIIDSFDMADTGTFIRFDGTVMPW